VITSLRISTTILAVYYLPRRETRR